MSQYATVIKGTIIIRLHKSASYAINFAMRAVAEAMKTAQSVIPLLKE